MDRFEMNEQSRVGLIVGGAVLALLCLCGVGIFPRGTSVVHI